MSDVASFLDGSGKPSAILIDCDGTIFPNVENAHEDAACRTLFQELVALDSKAPGGIQVNYTFIREVWHDTLGGGIRPFFQAYLDRHKKVFGEDLSLHLKAENLEAAYENTYINFAKQAQNADASPELKRYFAVRQGLAEVFQWAHANGIPVIAVSNATQRILETSLSAAPHLKFNDIIGSDTARNAGYGIKPEGGIYLYAMRKHELDSSRVIGIEDTVSGMLSLDAAQISKIVRCKNCENETKADQHLAANDVVPVLTVTTDCNLFTGFRNFINIPLASPAQKPGSVPGPVA